MTRAIALSSLVLAAGFARAQTPATLGSTVTYTLSASVVGGDGIEPVNPGESVLLTIKVSFSGQNTTASYTPATPAPGSGTIRGFGMGLIDVRGTGTGGSNANGTWNVNANSGYGTNSTWDLFGPGGWGTPANSGSDLINIQFGQFPTNASQINTTNPINVIWRGLWTPLSYEFRYVDFAIAQSPLAATFPSSIVFQTGSSQIAHATCPTVFSQVRLDINSPSPSTLMVFGMAALVARRRRMRGS